MEKKIDAIYLYKTRGMWTETVSPFRLLKEIWLTLMYCTVCGNDTKHVYTTNKYWNIFFCTKCFPLCSYLKHKNTLKKKKKGHVRPAAPYITRLQHAYKAGIHWCRKHDLKCTNSWLIYWNSLDSATQLGWYRLHKLMPPSSQSLYQKTDMHSGVWNKDSTER